MPFSSPPQGGTERIVRSRFSRRSSAKPPQRTLIHKIMLWIFGPLFLLWTVGIVITYFIAQHIANSPYDRTLRGHLDLLRQELSQQDVLGPVSLSESASTILRQGSDAPTLWQIRDADGTPLAGNADLPLPENWDYENNLLRYRDVVMAGQSMRLAYVWGSRDKQNTPFLTIVAETNQHRSVLHHEILIGMLTPQFILVPLAAMLAGLGLTHGLEPLNLLQARLRARAPGDLSPVESDQAPAEIVPLIDAMNGLLERQAQFSAAQRRFVANAAHQLKTPLAGIRTQAEVALRERDPAQTEASLRQLVRGTQRATRLVNQMLALARAESSDALHATNAQAIELNTLAEQHLSQWVPRALQLGLDLGLESAGRPIVLQADSVMVGELLNNLLDNALIYTPSGGWVTLRTGRTQSHGWLEVEDNGPGIAPEHHARVFDRFYRIMGSQADGSGLGLAIVREIADIHGATIAFLPPSAGQASGTRLRVSFPLTPPRRL